MPSTAVNNSVTLFFITCRCFADGLTVVILFQPVSAALGKIVGVKYWLPFLMVAWGLFTLAHAYVRSEGELIAYRLMVGL